MRQLFIWLVALASLAGYMVLAAWFPLDPAFHRFPLPDVRALAPSLAGGLIYAGLLCILYGLYGLAFRQVRLGKRPPSLAAILLAAGLFCLPLVFTFPINATDVYGYFMHGRIVTRYGENPFVVSPSAFPNDPYSGLTAEWAGTTSPYGPLWVLVASVVSLVSGDSIQLGLCLFKGLAAAVHLLLGWLIWLGLAQAPPAERAARTLLWAWNPALLLIFVVDGHNDGFMLLWLVLGALLVQRRPWWGLSVMILAPLTKLIGLLPLPFFYLLVLRRSPNNRSRLGLLSFCGVASLVIVALAFLPIAPGTAGLLESLGGMVARIQREASRAAGFSPATLMILLSDWLGLQLRFEALVRAGVGVLLLLASWLLWRTARGRSPVRGAADLVGAYLLQALNFRIWYPAWLLPWLLLDPNGRSRLTAGLWLLLMAQLSVVVYGHLWALTLGQDMLASHLIGVPLVFGLPWLAAAVQQQGKARSRPRDPIGVS